MSDLHALISGYVPLHKTANTNGGEYHGACPLCGGKDRLAVWPNANRPGWWCRHCNKNGDAIQFFRELGHGYADACRMAGEEPRERAAPTPIPPAECNPPTAAWRAAGAAFVLFAQAELSKAPSAVAYLHARGLTDATIARFGLGYNPANRETSRARWGLEPQNADDRMWLPAGIVIPTYADNALWKIQIRRDEMHDKQDRYKTVTGSANAPLGADSVQPSKPAMLVEGPFDAMAVSQAAGDLIGVAAVGTSGARAPRWITRFVFASETLIALDADAAGDTASAWWLDKLLSARRWRPTWADPAQMLQDNADVRGWALAGLGKAPIVKPVHPELVGFWQFCLARQSDEHLARLRDLCRAGGYDYDATVEWIDAQPLDADVAAMLDTRELRAA